MLPTAADPRTGVPISRITSGPGTHLMPYYSCRALSADGAWLACTYDTGGAPQAWVYDMRTGEGHAISNAAGGVQHESACFHPTRPWVFYNSATALYRHDLSGGRTDVLFTTQPPFRILCEVSPVRDWVVLSVVEEVTPGRCGDGRPMAHLMSLRIGQSYILAVNLGSGEVRAVWSDTAALTHPILHPADDGLVLFANQGPRERRQELFVIAREERDDRKPRRLYESTEQRPIYVGHSFFTDDGWIACQLNEFGGREGDGPYRDIIGYNAIIRRDGSCDRRARCPGGNKPVHVHAARADGWWVGDTYPEEGACDDGWLCIMRNNWETGWCQAERLAAHGCDHSRPCHVHPRFTPDEKSVLFNSNFTGHSQIYAAHVEEFLSRWSDRAPFAPRRWRFCRQPASERSTREGPPL